MKLSLAQEPAYRDPDPHVGDLYRNQRGRLMMVVAISDRAYVIQFDRDGNACRSDAYGLHYLADKTKIGRVPDFDGLNLNAEWFEP